MRRTPLGGLFIAATIGVEIAEIVPAPLLYWAIGFGSFAIAVAAWKQTTLVLSATLLFFGFWDSFRKTSDRGYQLRTKPEFIGRIHQIDFEAEADSKPFHWGNQIKQRLLAKVTAIDGCRLSFRVQAELVSQPIHYGDSGQVTGRLALPQCALNPGEFDERTYLAHQGIYLVLDSANSHAVTILRHGWGNPILAIALQCRKAVEDIPVRSLENDRPIKALIEGVTFGDRSGFDPDLLDLLQDTGTLHLFVIDGLKVTLLAGVSWLAARFFCLPRRWIAGVVVPLLVLYCAATGLSAAGLRATLMALFVLIGVSFERPGLQLNALSGAGLILLLYNPQELFQLGFQLSFVIVAFIVIAARPLTSWLVHPFNPDPWIPSQLISPARRVWQRSIHRCAELLAVCTICWVASLPFSVFYFHRISFTNVLANFLAVPVGTWILFTALLSILISPLASWASIYLNNTNWLLAHLFLVIVNGSASCPGQAMNVGSFSWWTDTKIVVLASGRSETLYYCHGSTNGLINPGSASKYRRITEPFLRTEGVNSLSFLNWTKSDPDHAGSAAELEKHFRIAPGLTQSNFAEKSLSPKVGVGRSPSGKEKINLNAQIAGLKSSTLIQPVLECELGSFEILFLDINRQQIERLPSQIVDVVVVPSPRQYSYLEVVHRFHPQAILYLQGKAKGADFAPPPASDFAPTAPLATSAKLQPSAQTPAVPAWFVGESGAVTLAVSDGRLELSSYLGERLTLRSRSR